MVAVALFALVGGAAALLHYYTQVLARLDMPTLILSAIKATEYFLFAVDLLCFVVYVSRETWVAAARYAGAAKGGQPDPTWRAY